MEHAEMQPSWLPADYIFMEAALEEVMTCTSSISVARPGIQQECTLICTAALHQPPVIKPSPHAMFKLRRPGEHNRSEKFLLAPKCSSNMRAVPEYDACYRCVIVRDGKVVSRGHNMTNAKRNGTRHAEFEAIDSLIQAEGGCVQAAAFNRCQLYVTVEPCIMCAGALSQMGFQEVVYGAGNDRFGGCGSILTVHQDGCGACGRDGAGLSPGYTVRAGLYADEAVRLLQDFYAAGNPAAPKPHRTVRNVS